MIFNILPQYYSNAEIVAKASPNCVKKADNISISFWDLSLAITQAKAETKVTNSQGSIHKSPPDLLY